MKDLIETQAVLTQLRKDVRETKTKINRAKARLKWIDALVLGNGNGWTTEELVQEDRRERGILHTAMEMMTKLEKELAEKESTRPEPTKHTHILNWFKGNALEKAKDALELLAPSEEQGFWMPGASRKVRAALGKSGKAKSITSSMDKGYNAGKAVTALYSAMRYGALDKLLRITLQDATKELSDDLLEFYVDFQPIAQLLQDLDDTRPKPTFTNLGVSPTITATLQDMRMNLNPETIRVCPIEYVPVWITDKETGKKSRHWVAKLVWPKGTIHGASRYSETNDNRQCQSCGHAIKNPYNWVPILIDSKKGVPHSLWTGRDCAKSLFGIDMKGELELDGGRL